MIDIHDQDMLDVMRLSDDYAGPVIKWVELLLIERNAAQEMVSSTKDVLRDFEDAPLGAGDGDPWDYPDLRDNYNELLAAVRKAVWP